MHDGLQLLLKHGLHSVQKAHVLNGVNAKKASDWLSVYLGHKSSYLTVDFINQYASREQFEGRESWKHKLQKDSYVECNLQSEFGEPAIPSHWIPALPFDFPCTSVTWIGMDAIIIVLPADRWHCGGKIHVSPPPALTSAEDWVTVGTQRFMNVRYGLGAGGIPRYRGSANSLSKNVYIFGRPRGRQTGSHDHVEPITLSTVHNAWYHLLVPRFPESPSPGSFNTSQPHSPLLEQNCSIWQSPFACHKRTGGVLMVGSLPSSSIVLQWLLCNRILWFRQLRMEWWKRPPLANTGSSAKCIWVTGSL
jgi:hypothetical protein